MVLAALPDHGRPTLRAARVTPATDWQKGAACVGNTALFFAPTEGPVGKRTEFDFGPALAICRSCDAIAACRAWAVAAGEIDGDGRAVHCVVAGVAPLTQRGKYRPPALTLKRCRIEDCEVMFVGTSKQWYCSAECLRASKLIRQREYNRRVGAS